MSHYNYTGPECDHTCKCIEYQSWDISLQFYKTLGRPHLVYCMPFWSPQYGKVMNVIERVQRRFTRMLPASKYCSYGNRMERLSLFSLDQRRLRGDLVKYSRL